MNLPRFLYHGTSDKYLESLFEHGLVPGTHFDSGIKASCLTDEIGIAFHHGRIMAEWDMSGIVIFRIPVVELSPEGFVLDENFVRLAPSFGRGRAAYEASGDGAWKARAWTWREMLSVAGAVAYTGVIPLSDEHLFAVQKDRHAEMAMTPK